MADIEIWADQLAKKLEPLAADYRQLRMAADNLVRGDDAIDIDTELERELIKPVEISDMA